MFLLLRRMRHALLEKGATRRYLASMLDDLALDARRIDHAVAGKTVLLEGLDQLLRTLSLPADTLLVDERLQRQLFLQAQKQLGDDLAGMIRATYGLP